MGAEGDLLYFWVHGLVGVLLIMHWVCNSCRGRRVGVSHALSPKAIKVWRFALLGYVLITFLFTGRYLFYFCI